MQRKIIDKLRRGVELEDYEIDYINGKFREGVRYGLVWEDHPEDVDLELKDGVFNIEELKDKRIECDPNGRENLLLEGDNLHSLMALKEAGVEVDVIYIDPPYNTLNEEGFRYNDKRVDSNDSYRHSKWLSFMYKRLELARDLMTEDGVIFVSIDDNEQANLKLLMDQVFGVGNFIANFIYRKTGQQQNNGVNVAVTHEYILCYAKELACEGRKKKKVLRGDSIKDRKGFKQYKHKDDVGYYRLNPMRHKNIGKYSYALKHPKTNKEVTSDYWIVSKERYEELYDKNMVHWTKNLPNTKKYLDLSAEVLINNYIDGHYNEQGDQELKNIIGLKVRFNNPKNTDLIKYILKRKGRDAVVLDFFAGSGTTGQAVMELNKEDGGNRRFILCTNNENNICEEVTYERNRRVITGEYAKEKVEPLPNNLSYYRVGVENKDEVSYAEKDELDVETNKYLIEWVEDVKTVNETEEYVVLEGNNKKVLYLKVGIISENVREEIDVDDMDKVYMLKHLSRDKLFKGVDESKLELI